MESIDGRCNLHSLLGTIYLDQLGREGLLFLVLFSTCAFTCTGAHGTYPMCIIGGTIVISTRAAIDEITGEIRQQNHNTPPTITGGQLRCCETDDRQVLG